jgi:hypothetical protein
MLVDVNLGKGQYHVHEDGHSQPTLASVFIMRLLEKMPEGCKSSHKVQHPGTYLCLDADVKLRLGQLPAHQLLWKGTRLTEVIIYMDTSVIVLYTCEHMTCKNAHPHKICMSCEGCLQPLDQWLLDQFSAIVAMCNASTYTHVTCDMYHQALAACIHLPNLSSPTC